MTPLSPRPATATRTTRPARSALPARRARAHGCLRAALAGLLGACAALPAAAEMLIQLSNGQVVRLPYKRGEVARIEFVGEGVALLPSGGFVGPVPPVNGGAAATPGGPGTPWVVNAQGAIYQRADGSWQKVAGAARHIGVGADGTAWVIGTEPAPGGRVLYRLGPNGWVKVDGGAERIAVGPDGQPWVITNTGAILRRVGQRWQAMPGAARDIGIGADGSVWVIGLDPAPGGNGVHRWQQGQWLRIDGGGVRVAVGPDGQPWVVQASGTVLRRMGAAWQPLPGRASDIAVGSDGTAWVIGAETGSGNAGILRWAGGRWQRVDGVAQSIAVR